jgi:DNA-binding transcriptional regulator YdaS (Cro superfamily)
MLEVLSLYFKEQGRTITETDTSVTPDLEHFFEFYKVISAKALSERTGMNQSLLAQYIKGNKKPFATQARTILQGVQQVGKELVEMQLLQQGAYKPATAHQNRSPHALCGGATGR